MSHTPGPWFVTNEDPKGVQVHGIDGGFVCRAAWMVGVSRSGSEGPSPDAVTVVMLPSRTTARANARLIAAAPEMLDAIRAMLEAYQKWNRRADGGEDDLHYAATMLQSAAEAAASRQAIDGTV